MAHPKCIQLGRGRDLLEIPILFEDRSVIAIDKPFGWLLVPFSWQSTQRNLGAAISSSIAGGDFWAKSRGLKYLRPIHRLDAETTGILLFAKSPGALHSYGDLFESRRMEKRYLAVVHGVPKQKQWVCRARLAPDPKQIGKMTVDAKKGKNAETAFRVLEVREQTALVEARPVTGRTHQIRIHLLRQGHPVLGDPMYGPGVGQPLRRLSNGRQCYPMGLRAVRLQYADPFRRKRIDIKAPVAAFLREFEFEEFEPRMDADGRE